MVPEGAVCSICGDEVMLAVANREEKPLARILLKVFNQDKVPRSEDTLDVIDMEEKPVVTSWVTTPMERVLLHGSITRARAPRTCVLCIMCR
jgi:hypothetical protein